LETVIRNLQENIIDIKKNAEDMRTENIRLKATVESLQKHGKEPEPWPSVSKPANDSTTTCSADSPTQSSGNLSHRSEPAPSPPTLSIASSHPSTSYVGAAQQFYTGDMPVNLLDRPNFNRFQIPAPATSGSPVAGIGIQLSGNSVDQPDVSFQNYVLPARTTPGIPWSEAQQLESPHAVNNPYPLPELAPNNHSLANVHMHSRAFDAHLRLSADPGSGQHSSPTSSTPSPYSATNQLFPHAMPPPAPPHTSSHSHPHHHESGPPFRNYYSQNADVTTSAPPLQSHPGLVDTVDRRQPFPFVPSQSYQDQQSRYHDTTGSGTSAAPTYQGLSIVTDLPTGSLDKDVDLIPGSLDKAHYSGQVASSSDYVLSGSLDKGDYSGSLDKGIYTGGNLDNHVNMPIQRPLSATAASSRQQGELSHQHPRSRTRRRTESSDSDPASPESSPGPYQLSDTLMMIKAHAFGGVRKPRMRGSGTSSRSGAAKSSMDVLAARGLTGRAILNGGLPHVEKRRKHHHQPHELAVVM